MKDCPTCGIHADRECELCEGMGIVPSVCVDAEWIKQAYAAYDSDPRVNGPDDFEAFREAVQRQWSR